MLQPVNVGTKGLAGDTHIVGRELTDEIRARAEPLKGRRVGVSELLSTLVCLRKSTREGFGLTVSEALSKARPFIGGDVGGIPLQLEDGVSGYLVSDVETCAARTLPILRDPELGIALGRHGKERVRAHFLTPRYLRDPLRVFTALEAQG